MVHPKCKVFKDRRFINLIHSELNWHCKFFITMFLCRFSVARFTDGNLSSDPFMIDLYTGEVNVTGVLDFNIANNYSLLLLLLDDASQRHAAGLVGLLLNGRNLGIHEAN